MHVSKMDFYEVVSRLTVLFSTLRLSNQVEQSWLQVEPATEGNDDPKSVRPTTILTRSPYPSNVTATYKGSPTFYSRIYLLRLLSITSMSMSVTICLSFTFFFYHRTGKWFGRANFPVVPGSEPTEQSEGTVRVLPCKLFCPAFALLQQMPFVPSSCS